MSSENCYPITLSTGHKVQASLLPLPVPYSTTQVVQYLNIPYCQPPTNNLRFRAPQPLSSSTADFINFPTFQTSPPQRDMLVFPPPDTNSDEEIWIPEEPASEDCLYLNIWTPVEGVADTQKKLFPVFIWIYGGGFVGGSSSLEIYNGAKLASIAKCVVVSFNYRTGPLGFLRLEYDGIDGNQGLEDQIFALKWIKQEISRFGGDAENMTLAGNSAGGCSVSLHLLIEESWTCFHKVILESGGSWLDWAFTDAAEIKRRSLQCVNSVIQSIDSTLEWNEIDSDKQQLLKILQQVDFNEYFKDDLELNEFMQFGWTPCNDGQIITVSRPRDLFKQGKFKICPTIFLNTRNESTYFLLHQFPELLKYPYQILDFDLPISYARNCLKFYPYLSYEMPQEGLEEIFQHYLSNKKPTAISLVKLDELCSDRYFVCDSIDCAQLISQYNAPLIYLYYEAFFPVVSWPSWVGAMHGDEIYALFGLNLNGEDKVGAEQMVALDIIKKMENFFYSGFENIDFPHFTKDHPNIVRIDGNGWHSSTFSDRNLNNVEFWKSFHRKYYKLSPS